MSMTRQEGDSIDSVDRQGQMNLIDTANLPVFVDSC